MHPKVSVCMTTYNHARFIAQALDSVLAQRTTFDYEIVIGEDCSTDGTRETVLRYWQQNPSRIRVLLAGKNLGVVRNTERTIQACRGDYIAMLEGDDYWTDVHKLQHQAELLDAEPDAFICGARAHVWKDGEPQPSCVSPSQASEVLATYGARELFEGKWWFRSCTKMLPRPMMQGAPRRFMQDWAGTLWLIARTDFGKVCFLDRVVGGYREHAGGVWSSQNRTHHAIEDAQTLFRVIPLFKGQDRRYLEGLLQYNVATLLESDDVLRSVRIRCAAIAAFRSPGNPQSWRNLKTSVRLAFVNRRQEIA